MAAGQGDMPHGGRAASPKDDSEYFERMSRAIFAAGLSWEKDVKSLMGDAGIVRNERKIRATIHNAGEIASLKKEFGSFKGYVASFGRDEDRLQKDLQEKFKHVGGSTARMFLWSVGYKLTPTS